MLSQNYEINPPVALENFEDSTEWTAAGGTIANDSTIVRPGSTKSLKLTSGSGTNCIATKTISLDLSRAGLIGFWIYIEGAVADALSLQVIVSNDSGFANFFSKSFSGVYHEGWNFLPIGKTQWASTGSPDWNTTFTRLRVRVNANTAVSPVVYYDSMVMQYYSRPKCVISFDDGWDSQYLAAYDYMRKWKLRGSLYLIKQRIDTAGYMTTAQVTALFNEGWDVLNHTDNHVNMVTQLADANAVQTELTACADWIKANGWSRRNGEKHVAYPNGAYDAKVFAGMTGAKMITGRTIINRTQGNYIDEAFMICRQSHAYTASAATYKAYIDRTIAEGGCIILNYHKIVADAAGVADTEVELSQFQDMINYLVSKSRQIDVVTFTEWYDGLTVSRAGKTTDFIGSN